MSLFRFTAVRTDAEIVRRVRSGDTEAYGELVRRHQEALYRHACGMGLDHDTSLDLVQDTFVKGYARLAECRNDEYVRAWLYRILRNLCLDYLKNVRRAAVSLHDVAEADIVAFESAGEAVVLTDVLERLPLAMREAFLLKHEAGYTYEEIAEMTDSTPSAVKMRVHRAREVLRELLADRAVA